LLKGELAYAPQMENLVLLVRQVCGQEHASLQRRQVTMDINLPVTPLMVSLDRVRMQSALEALLSFVGRATPNAGTVSVKLSSVGELAQLEISDTGPGLGDEAVSALADLSAFTEVEGLRIAEQVALRVVRQTVEQGHGGLFAVSAQPGQGNRFTLSLPLAVSAPVDFPASVDSGSTPSERVIGPWEDVLERQKPFGTESRT